VEIKGEREEEEEEEEDKRKTKETQKSIPPGEAQVIE